MAQIATQTDTPFKSFSEIEVDTFFLAHLPLCAMCRQVIPADRRSKGFQSRGCLTCSDECAAARIRINKSRNIKKCNADLTPVIPAGNKQDGNKVRNDFLLGLFKGFALYRIGYYRNDKVLNGLARLKAEAITNSFLFSAEPTYNVYNVFIAYANKHFDGAKTSLFKSEWLLSIAIERNWVAVNYEMISQELKISSSKTKAPSAESVSIPAPTNVTQMVPAKVEQPVNAVVPQATAIVEPNKHREPIPQPIAESPSRPEFTSNDYKIWTKAIEGIKPSTIAVAFCLGIDRNDFTTETDIMRHVAALVQSGNQDAISAMQRYKTA